MSHSSVRLSADTTTGPATNNSTTTTDPVTVTRRSTAEPSVPAPAPAEPPATADLEPGGAHSADVRVDLGDNQPGLGGSMPLDVAERAFDLLMRGPVPLSVNGVELGEGLPARPVPLDELRVILLHPSCSRTTRDHVWRHLIDQARTHRGAWMVAAVALAIPMLRRLVSALADRVHAEQADRLARVDWEDLEAEVLAAYMEALVRVKLAWSHPVLRLSRLTQFAVLRALAIQPPRLLADPDLIDRTDEQQALAYPAGHPDLLLAQAVTEGVITELEAELIGFTRLEGIPLSSYCRRRALLYCTALKRRQRAENALYQALLARSL